MDIAFLKALSSIRNPALDALFQGITFLGEEALLIAALCLIYWCINKRMAVRMLFGFFIVGLVVQALKISFCVPRPWVRDPSFMPVQSAMAGASGFSFPSGHTASAVAMYGSLALMAHKRSISIGCWVVAALVGFSRLYLGVHTPQDVLVSLVLSVALLLMLNKVFAWMDADARAEGIVFRVGLIAAAGLAVYGQFKPYPDMEGISKLVLDTFKVSGAAIGLFLGWRFERRKVSFDVKARLPVQAVKYCVGMALIAGIMLFKMPGALVGERLWALIQYAALAFAALALWPLCFSRRLAR